MLHIKIASRHLWAEGAHQLHQKGIFWAPKRYHLPCCTIQHSQPKSCQLLTVPPRPMHPQRSHHTSCSSNPLTSQSKQKLDNTARAVNEHNPQWYTKIKVTDGQKTDSLLQLPDGHLWTSSLWAHRHQCEDGRDTRRGEGAKAGRPSLPYFPHGLSALFAFSFFGRTLCLH